MLKEFADKVLTVLNQFEEAVLKVILPKDDGLDVVMAEQLYADTVGKLDEQRQEYYNKLATEKLLDDIIQSFGSSQKGPSQDDQKALRYLYAIQAYLADQSQKIIKDSAPKP
jgi:uncharacterized UPF0160 family protein